MSEIGEFSRLTRPKGKGDAHSKKNRCRVLLRSLDALSPDVPLHAQRDQVAEVATTLGLLTGTLGKIARDVSVLMQLEVAEALEPAAPGRGRSSIMPHKRNPVGSAVVLGAAIRVPALVSVMLTAMVQEHEQGPGDWHAEWNTLPALGSAEPLVDRALALRHACR